MEQSLTVQEGSNILILTVLFYYRHIFGIFFLCHVRKKEKSFPGPINIIHLENKTKVPVHFSLYWLAG